MYSLDSHKSFSPNSTLAKVWKLLKNDIPLQLSDICFSTGQYPSARKTAKHIPTHIKQSNVDYTIYRAKSLLSNIEKIIEKAYV